MNACRKFKLPSNFFIFVLAFVISFIYFTSVILTWLWKIPINIGSIVYLIIFHIFLCMFIWSFYRSVNTDPGKVPLCWGFFMGDSEHKKRRYCLICHIFKPERCHHCSSCNRCVLNMDHHCPWINNCIGFYNRKFFLLMLFYVILTTFIVMISGINGLYFVISEIVEYFSDKTGTKTISAWGWTSNILIILGWILDVAIFFVILFFFKFHIELVLKNTTTLENLDRRRQTNMQNNNASHAASNFDMGRYYNWVQVFGRNFWLWPFPMFLNSGKPVGDGVVWPMPASDQQRTQANEDRQNQSTNNYAGASRQQPQPQQASARNDYDNRYGSNNNDNNNARNAQGGAGGGGGGGGAQQRAYGGGYGQEGYSGSSITNARTGSYQGSYGNNGYSRSNL